MKRIPTSTTRKMVGKGTIVANAVERDALILPEKDFQEWLRQLALVTGWLYFHVNRSIHSPSGFPDTVLAKPGRQVIYIELKTDDLGVSQPSFDQWCWLYTLQHSEGCDAYLFRPSDRDFIEQLLV